MLSMHDGRESVDQKDLCAKSYGLEWSLPYLLAHVCDNFIGQ